MSGVIPMPISLKNGVSNEPVTTKSINELKTKKKKQEQKHYNRVLVVNGYYKDYYKNNKEKYNRISPEKQAQKEEAKKLRKLEKDKSRVEKEVQQKEEKQSMHLTSSQTVSNSEEPGDPQQRMINISVLIRKPLEDVPRARRRVLRYVSSVLETLN